MWVYLDVVVSAEIGKSTIGFNVGIKSANGDILIIDFLECGVGGFVFATVDSDIMEYCITIVVVLIVLELCAFVEIAKAVVGFVMVDVVELV